TSHVTLCLSCTRTHADLPSFPTRRSSDLVPCRPEQAARKRSRGTRFDAREQQGAQDPVSDAPGADGAVGAFQRFAQRRQLLAHRSEEHTSELQSLAYLVCRLLLEKKKNIV